MRMHKDLRWQQMDKSSIELNKVAELYDVFNRSEGKSSKTVDWYNEVLKLFHNWLRRLQYIDSI